MTDLYTPFIVDDSFEPSAFVGDSFGDQFEGLVAGQGPFLSMSAFEKADQRNMLGHYADSNGYATYGDASTFNPQIYQERGVAAYAQEPDFDYISDDALSTPDQKKVPLMATQGRQPSNTSYSEFSYKSEPAQENGRKRKCDSPQYDVAPPPAKKPTTAQLQVNSSYYDVSGETSPYSSLIPTPNSTTSFHPSPAVFTSARPSGHQYSTSTASQISLTAPSPHTPAGWSPSFATIRTEPSPPAPMTPAPRPATASPLRSSAPRLVRTSTIQQPSPHAPGHVNTISTSFNPYTLFPMKANLKLNGNLDDMMKGWSEEEKQTRRRLVEFKRNQEGCDITADFKPVTQNDRSPSSITISCIWWEEKNEYYVTSVDTIYLLEALVGVRFTVEEKNRIRRNLEGFRPATVSKSKTDSEEFFKVIMGFPHPKPRNIEKDVKVFTWRNLSIALGKIIGKYSASYSSTLAALPQVPSNYGSEHVADYSYDASPQPEYAAPIPHYAVAHSYPTGPISGRMSAPVTTAPIPQLGLQVTTSGPSYNMNDVYGFSPMPGMPQASMFMPPEAMTAPVQLNHNGWNFHDYISSNPVSAPPNSAPPMAYHRGAIETADFGPPAHYMQ